MPHYKESFSQERMRTDTNPAHVEPTMIPLVKETSTDKSYGEDVKLKMRRYPTSSRRFGFVNLYVDYTFISAIRLSLSSTS